MSNFLKNEKYDVRNVIVRIISKSIIFFTSNIKYISFKFFIFYKELIST